MSDAAIFLPFAPVPDRDSQPYWDALAKGRLSLQRCDDCGTLRWPARAVCNRCHSFASHWEDQTGSGQIASWVRTHQAFAPALQDAVPYTVVQVRLDAQEDLLLIGGWRSDREPRFGERVSLEIVDGPEGFALPCWRPSND
ncbi:MAG: hypothetical protein CL908_07240 [Deltaproteobacteria bacterium]|nr:hypothetical protein [Deltaproteobacteria bacterium]